MFKRLSALFIFSFLGLLIASSASAAGIGIAPRSLSITHDTGMVTDTSISVHNTGETTALYTIYADEYERLIQIDGEEIQLAPGEGRVVPIKIESFPPGEYRTNISLVATEVSEEELPKTGVKLPVTIVSRAIPSVGQATMIRQYSLYFILFAFLVLLMAVYLNKRKSRVSRIIDSAQETLASHSLEKTANHYRKKHPLVFVSLLALLIAGSLLIWSFVETSRSPEPPQVNQGLQEYYVTIQSPDGASVYTVQSEKAISAFTALEQIRDEYGITLTYDPPVEFGILVTEMDGYENGQDGKYWVYEVNGEAIPVAADRHPLQPNDQLLWKFVEPSAEF